MTEDLLAWLLPPPCSPPLWRRISGAAPKDPTANACQAD